MITALYIETYCIDCEAVTGHELNTVACEIDCMTCKKNSQVSEHYVTLMVEEAG